MAKKNNFIIGVLAFVFVLAFLQTMAQGNEKISVETYIETYKDIAIAQMHTYKIPASIKLAQGILESASGNSDLAIIANNHFGIKCHYDWQGATYHKDDDAKDECFRKYKHAEESFTDHSLFLTTKKRYAALFELDITNYKGWAKGLKEAGYATNPKYPTLLINLIEKYNLYTYDTDNISPGIVQIDPKDSLNIPTPTQKRIILHNNNVKYITARKSDTFEALAKELKMGLWQFYRYNELDNSAVLKEGQIVYLQPKRRRSLTSKEHVVKAGETLYGISQQYGIKTKHLHRLNSNLHPDGDIEPGQVILLQRKSFK